MTTARAAAVGAALVLAAACQRAPDASVAVAQEGTAASPRLLVVVVVDQMRFDYLARDARFWRAGFARLTVDGAVFERAFYPYLNTVTCAGHATIGTGTFPYRHGIILNEWHDRTAGRNRSCTDDPSARSVPYGDQPEAAGHSAARLRVPTLGDRLRAASPASRVVTLSMKPRSTIMLAGHGGTAVTWFGETNAWATSSAYATAPLGEVASIVREHPVERDRQTVWEREREPEAYAGEDESAYERPRRGWTSIFPHPLAGVAGTPPARFFDLWERSPFADAYLGRMAAALVRAYQLGQRDTVDYLGVSFSGLDYVGHDFGPDSQEVQDTLARLDGTLGALLNELDATVGRDRYVLALSADHGVARIPEARRAEGGDAGRVVNGDVEKTAQAAMAAAYGPGEYVARVEYTNLYLTPSARERAAADAGFLKPLFDAVMRIDGVSRVFPSRGLETRRTSEDPVERAAAFSHHPEESGDVVIVLKPEWIGTNTSAATHGTWQPYDQHVPVILFGAGVKAGRYAASASPADIAPTLAAIAHVPMPDVDGRVLREALR